MIFGAKFQIFFAFRKIHVALTSALRIYQDFNLFLFAQTQRINELMRFLRDVDLG